MERSDGRACPATECDAPMKMIPASTYRVQLNPAFGFAEAQRILPYLSRLGISCLYASPIFKARRGSTHGYDVVDPTRATTELGSPQELEALFIEVRAHGMGWLQDIVPNHMAFDAENQMLIDVLENGPSSKYYPFFDVEWDHPYEGIKGRLLAPFLGDFYGESIEDGSIRLLYDEDGFAATYYDKRFPIKIESYADLLTYRLDTLRKQMPPGDPDIIKLHGILGVLYILKTMPPGWVSDDRYSQIRFIKVMLWELYNQNELIRQHIDDTISVLNDRPNRPASIEWVDSLLGDQFFRLSYWKVAVEEINYRRFFNINDLISLRVEEQSVFEATHSLIFQWVREGKISGIRIDHIDGLYNPTQYLDRLAERIPGTYTVVEKILSNGERLPEYWAVDGTTGYDFMNAVNGLFCNGENEKVLSRVYSRFTGMDTPFDQVVYEKKRFIALRRMAGDIENLAHLVKQLAGRYRRGSDLTLLGLKRAILETLSLLSVYRTYINPDSYRSQDRSIVKEAIDKARRQNPEWAHELAFIDDLHNPEFHDSLRPEDRAGWLHAVMRFQQLTGPLMAKGFEDTALYIYNRLLSLNEVGGHPGKVGMSVSAFHELNRARFERHPHTLNATSTHDSKRGEDVRARINVLSELVREWEGNLSLWSKVNGRLKVTVNGQKAPHPNDEYALYQSIIGALPFGGFDADDFVRRIKDYTLKAVREAKIHTNWLTPNEAYESAICSFIDRILAPDQSRRFLESFIPFQKRIAQYGIWNSLAQTLLKMTSPGIPDFYQGTELWDLNLVDPDNRRPVDFELRDNFLIHMQSRENVDILGLIDELLAMREDGRVKLFLISRVLRARNANAELFTEGAYKAIDVKGRRRKHVVAFLRQMRGRRALIAAPRLLTDVIAEDQVPVGTTIWGDTRVTVTSAGRVRWKNAITGQTLESDGSIAVGDLFEHFPVALLMQG